MATFVPFPSIEKFSNVIKDVQHEYRDSKAPFRTMTFKGTTKLHGTNAAIGYKPTERISWAQSRNLVLSKDKPDNCGFRGFVESIATLTETLHDWYLAIEKNCDVSDIESIIFFGEYAGQGIQSNVAISELSKLFVIFDVLVTFTNKNEHWLPETIVQNMKLPEYRIFNVHDYQTWTLDINFNEPEMVQKQLEAITDQVEKCCPVAHAFGFKGIGEGVVWRTFDATTKKVYRFKVKGSEHCVTKSKTGETASIDTEKIENVKSFIEYAVTENRMKQGLHELFHAKDQVPTMKSIKSFLDWVKADVLKEEADALAKNGLDEKAVSSAIAQHARLWFMKQIV